MAVAIHRTMDQVAKAKRPITKRELRLFVTNEPAALMHRSRDSRWTSSDCSFSLMDPRYLLWSGGIWSTACMRIDTSSAYASIEMIDVNTSPSTILHERKATGLWDSALPSSASKLIWRLRAGPLLGSTAILITILIRPEKCSG